MALTLNFSDSSVFNQTLTVSGVTSYNNRLVRTLTGSRTGERVPDYKEKIRLGQNATSNFTSNRLKYTGTSAGSASLSANRLDSPFPNVPQQYSGYAIPPVTTVVHSGSTASAEAIALSQLYRKIDSELSVINSPAVIAEFGDVLRQFGHPLESILDLTNRRINRLHLESRGLKGSIAFRKVKVAQIVASTYLEYAFGLAPLISDTRKAAEAVARWQYEKTGEYRFRSRVTGTGETTIASATTNDPQVISGSYFVFTQRNKFQTDNRCRYTCGLNTSTVAAYGSNDRLLQLLGFDPVKWIPAAWEVVPWSWLLDYVTNIGDILQASATNTTGVTWISKSVSQRSTRRCVTAVDSKLTSDRIKAFGFDSGTGSGTCGDWSILRTTMTRSKPASLGVPPLSFTLPSEWDIKKHANVAAALFARRPSSSALWLY